MNIIERFRQACLQKGDKPAVISNGIILSFHDLWEQSENLARFLAANYNDEKPIIVYGHKDPSMLVCFLACAKSGHPYCPVDVSMPYVRILDIINTIEKPVVLATEDFTAPMCTVISADKIRQISTFESKSAPQCSSKSAQSEASKPARYSNIDLEKTMYIIFTSGSTGKPKGVEISVENLSRFVDWSLTLFGENPGDDRVMNQAPFSFDLSVMDTYTALASGRTLCLLPKSMQKEVKDILDFIEENQINYIVSTPSFANMLLADKNFNASNYNKIRQFLFCGERLSKETAGTLMERFPEVRVINTYGPTESTVAVTGVEITREHLMAEEELPIGMPKPGTEIRIENEEIIIAGDTVGKGYFKDHEKTEAAFYTDKKGMRCYRTGDTGYINPDSGMLYYIGRIDNQIKLHGYRIELGDIEANLMQISGISDSAVLPKMKDGQIRSLTAFVVGRPSAMDSARVSNCCDVDGEISKASDSPDVCDGDADDKVDAGTSIAASDFETGKYIKAQLAEKLPHYMIPKKIKFLQEMPLTSNGKKDRKKLAELL